MSEKDELVFMQPFGEKEPRMVRLFDLIPIDVPIVDEQKRKLRMDTCKGCEFLEHNTMCSMCNCFMPIKTWMLSGDCPLNKWQ